MDRKRDVSVVVAPVLSRSGRATFVGLFTFSLAHLAIAGPLPMVPAETLTAPAALVETAKPMPVEAAKAAPEVPAPVPAAVPSPAPAPPRLPR